MSSLVDVNSNNNNIRVNSPPSNHSEYSNTSKTPVNKYTEMTEEDQSHNLKFSLAHYFSTVFVVFMLILLIATILLFIWSNTSDGAWVSLQVYPVLPTSNANNQFNGFNDVLVDILFPFAISLLSFNNNNNNNQLTNNNNPLSSVMDDIQNINYNPNKTLSSLLSNNNNELQILYNSINTILQENNNNNISQNLIKPIKDMSLNINIFSFSLVSSVSDFWQSKAYALAILIAAFSGVWPYIKLLLLILCWLIPLKQQHREAIIIFLDQMGKYSFIDLFVSLYMIVSFYVDIQKTYKGYGIDLKIVVEPDVGLNTFVIGTAISMIFSHVFLYLDAKYAKPHIKELQLKQQNELFNINDNNNQQFIEDQFEEEYAHSSDHLNVNKQPELEPLQISHKDEWNTTFRPLFTRFTPLSYSGILSRSFMLLLIICSLYSTIDCIFTAPVRYNITGLVGWAITNPVRAYTPWQIVTEVPTHTDEHSAGPPLAFSLFIVIIFFPVLLLLTIITIWFMPLRYKYLKYLNIIMQTSMAWAALDVFAIASIAASLELDRVSQWIMNENYAEICGPNGIIPKIFKGLGCFAVEGHLIWGTYLVLFAAGSGWVLFIYTIYSLAKAKKYWKTNMIKNDIADKTIFFFNH